MSLKFIKGRNLLKKFIFTIWLWDAKQKFLSIRKYLTMGEKILDIGTGPGSFCFLLNKRGFSVFPIDIKDQSLTCEVNPLIYDGKKIPFNTEHFDIALISTVLHHSRNPKELLLEAKRVAKKLIIVEDVYLSSFQKYLTYITDSIVNLEFYGHPHENKSDREWKATFNEVGLKLKDTQYRRFLLFFRQATYYLEK
ncbi:class I SAM-dependent methyltransferase [Desulfobacterota bacterium AH_259_B03_O07]|nr:class I SAM-dependent methyltransferase [Desulfobacterota bacterium AH_259_B03_O07]